MEHTVSIHMYYGLFFSIQKFFLKNRETFGPQAHIAVLKLTFLFLIHVDFFLILFKVLSSKVLTLLQYTWPFVSKTSFFRMIIKFIPILDYF